MVVDAVDVVDVFEFQNSVYQQFICHSSCISKLGQILPIPDVSLLPEPPADR